MYKMTDVACWQGRMNPDPRDKLWHQSVTLHSLEHEQDIAAGNQVGILGFCSDEGVKRNLGRPGAMEGPYAIRKALSNLAVHFEGSEMKIFDSGDVVVKAKDLETAQLELASCMGKLLTLSIFPVLVGGGHEISYGHLKGVLDHFSGGKTGVINFDPHFDLRTYPEGPHSGSWARQLFDEYDRFSYLPIGTNPTVNVRSMYDLMKEKQQAAISMDELLHAPREVLNQQIASFIDSIDHLCLTLDLDVFAASMAPGVSALNPYGVMPEHIRPLMGPIFDSDKLVGFDIAEMSPVHDDGRTAKLAASFVYDAVMSRICI